MGTTVKKRSFPVRAMRYAWNLFRASIGNPRRTRLRLMMKFERRFGISLYRLSPWRRVTRTFEMKWTSPLPPDAEMFGNYPLMPGLIPDDGVVLSLGIGFYTDFDEAIVERTKASITMVDPVPKCIEYARSRPLADKFDIQQVAASATDGEVELFMIDDMGGLEGTSAVAKRRVGWTSKKVKVPARRVSTILKDSGHDRLDVLKLDIEGMAEDIIRDTLDSGLRPTQIVGEFERPWGMFQTRGWLREMTILLQRLVDEGYELYHFRDSSIGLQIEILAVRNTEQIAADEQE